MVGCQGIEPWTYRLKAGYSTAELAAQCHVYFFSDCKHIHATCLQSIQIGAGGETRTLTPFDTGT